jgi:hypothetical protein
VEQWKGGTVERWKSEKLKTKSEKLKMSQRKSGKVEE